jgi:hypothetical protein
MEFKQSYDFAIFAINYELEKSYANEQFGREVVKFYNSSTKLSEIQMTFFSTA